MPGIPAVVTPTDNPNFLNFNLDYGQGSLEQAKQILDTVRNQTPPLGTHPVVGITYSANDTQIEPIRRAYEVDGNGISGISGANQA